MSKTIRTVVEDKVKAVIARGLKPKYLILSQSAWEDLCDEADAPDNYKTKITQPEYKGMKVIRTNDIDTFTIVVAPE